MNYSLQRCGLPDARTLVFSSGLGGASGFWKPHIERFVSTFDILLYDQRGTGNNPAELGQTSIMAMANDVLEICDDAGVARFDLIGHALGGLVGLDLASRPQTRLDRLVAINAWPEIDHHTARCFDIRLGMLQGQGLGPFVALQQNFLYPPFWISANPERIAAEEAHAKDHFQGTDNLKHRIDALRDFRLPAMEASPTRFLLIAAKDDALVDCTQSKHLAARLPNAQLVLYDQGGHALNITRQSQFETDTWAFLNDT